MLYTLPPLVCLFHLRNLERLAGIQRTMALSVLLSHKHEMPSINGYQKNPLVGNHYKI